MKKIYLTLVIAFLLMLVGFVFIGVSEYKKVDYGFVNTEKLLNSFVGSQIVMDELRVEEKKWLDKKAIIVDSLKAFESRMILVYDTSSVKAKKSLKGEQIRRIEELGRFEQAQINRLKELQTEKMQSIYQKINAAMSDFASEKGLDVVFASSNGSIVYGEGSSADLTEEFSRYLNNRFK